MVTFVHKIDLVFKLKHRFVKFFADAVVLVDDHGGVGWLHHKSFQHKITFLFLHLLVLIHEVDLVFF